MKIIVWLGRIALFLLFFVFALFNTEPATLNYVLGHWQAPLALVLLIFFLAGALFGVAVLLPVIFRQRAEVRRLGRSLSDANKIASAAEAATISLPPTPLKL
ncbi:MAG: LapA family protein [Burkholderiales bacterium]|jgi:putative membrane protein|nr:LapA family protein [Burkholderiales bacterium]MCA3153857.1 LapA family protein [Burkholderiales bacterium]